MANEKKYGITQEDEIVLYGYNIYCKNQVDKLITEGYNVICIIDKNAKYGESYQGIPLVDSIEQIIITEKVCVFIMLQNGMLHMDIVRDIYKHGGRRILFLPMETGFYNNEVQLEFIIQYNYMMEGNYLLLSIPYLSDEMFENSEEKKYRTVRKLDNGESIIWILNSVVRTTTKEEEKYRDIPIAEFKPYINLFRHLSGDKVEIYEYIRAFGNAPYPAESEEAYQYVIEKRHKLYEFFEEKFYSGNLEYFTVAAPKAVWNRCGWINLCEGQHRCVYLLSKGINMVPVRIDQNTKRMIDKML